MAESVASLRLLKRRIAAIEQGRPRADAPRVATGHAALDRAIGGGVARGRLHEVFARAVGDDGSATGFVGMLAVRLGGAIVWLREDMAERQGGMLHAAGLVEIGIDPARLIVGLMPDPLAVLRAAADVVRCPAVGVAVIELRRDPRPLDLTASRRLALAAESSGVTVLVLRIDGAPAPSAAETRWAAGAAASVPLAANAPGHPMLDIELLRQRGRPAGGRWQMEWDRDQASFRAPDAARYAAGDAGRPAPRGAEPGASSSGAVVSLPVGRPADRDPSAPRRRSG